MRLTTLVGPPGVGKTRLTLELERRLVERAELEAILACDLVDARTPLELCVAVARVLEVPLTSGGEEEAIRVVGTALANKGRALVFLDTFEQLARAAHVLPAWLAAAPGLQLVVSSRNPLGLAEESVFELAPLPTDGEDLSPAARLFIERASAASRGAAAPEVMAAVAEEIGRRLDGIPLAIELAAARTALIAPRQILERLDRALVVLSDPGEGRPAHQATMRKALAWSWGLLDDAAQRALARCSVFHGGFSLEAAEAVLDGLARPPLDLLDELITHSLIRRQPTAWSPAEADPTGPSGARTSGSASARAAVLSEPRFSMYAVIREFAAERLGVLGERELVLTRRDAYFVREARAWASRVREHGGRERMLRLAVEQENLLSVAREALEPGDEGRAEPALDALVSLSVAPVLTRTSGAQLEGLLGATLALAGPRATPLVLRARLALGRAMQTTGKPCAALALAEEVLSAPACADDPTMEAEALLLIGDVAVPCGHFDRATEALTRGLRLARQAGLAGLEARLEATYGGALNEMLRLEEGRRELLRAHALASEVGDELTEGVVLRLLGHNASEQGRTEDAAKSLEAGLELARQLGDKLLESTCTSDLAWVMAQDGRLEAAAKEYERALQCYRDLGNRWREANGTANIGLIQFWLGRLPEAERLMEAALRIFRPLAAHRQLSRISGRLAAVLATAGELERAAAMLEEARELASGARSEPKASGDGRPDLLLFLGLDEAYLLAARCVRARASGDFGAAYAHLGAAEAHLEAASAAAGSARSLVERSDDARLITRHLRAHLAALALQPAAFVVAEDFGAFVTPTGARGTVGARPSVRMVLEALVSARRAHPGEAVPWRRLFAAGWPGESVTPKVAKNRLYVTLAALRGLGLKDVIQSADGGWLLDPAIEVSVVPSGVIGSSAARHRTPAPARHPEPERTGRDGARGPDAAPGSLAR